MYQKTFKSLSFNITPFLALGEEKNSSWAALKIGMIHEIFHLDGTVPFESDLLNSVNSSEQIDAAQFFSTLGGKNQDRSQFTPETVNAKQYIVAGKSN